MNVHRTTLHGKCPLNGSWDYYELEVSTEEFFRVEELEELCDFVRGKSMSQEEMAKQLRPTLPSHCSMVLRGRHGQNCETEVRL